MVFTKTAQKFGQWSDPKAGTIYGVGFPNEDDLNKVGKTLRGNALINGSLKTNDLQSLVTCFRDSKI